MHKCLKKILLLKNNKSAFLIALLRRFAFLFPDSLYLRIFFRLRMGSFLNLDNPKTFGEKIQWLKLYCRDSIYTTLVDKYAVKDYVKEKFGQEYVIPTLGIWSDANEIDFENLPNQFVLKTTNGGGGDVIICRDKDSLDKNRVIKHLNKGLKKNIYRVWREWPYKNVFPRIIAEKYIEDKDGSLNDYKFFCFDGKVFCCQVIRNRYTKETIDFYDEKWNHMPFVGLNPVADNGNEPVEKPKNLSKMIALAERMSKNFPFLRVDLFSVDDHIYFGEYTFYPASGLGFFRPNEWNYKLGELIKLPPRR